MFTKALPLAALALATAACTSPARIAVMPPVAAPAPVAAPVPAPAPVANPQSAKARFLTAAALNGCVVNAATTSAILASATLSQDDLARILTELKNDGQGAVNASGTGFDVTGGPCADNTTTIASL